MRCVFPRGRRGDSSWGGGVFFADVVCVVVLTLGMGEEEGEDDRGGRGLGG